MVAPQKVCSKNEDKSPSPQPFEEPEGMVTIDLNSDTSSRSGEETKEDDVEKMKKGISICKTLLYLILFITLMLAVVVFIDEQTYLFKTKPIHIRTATKNAISTEKPFDEIVEKMYQAEEKEQLLKCVITKTLDDCCKIFTNEEYPELAEICTVNDILDVILITFDINEDTFRKKRDIYHDTRGNVIADPRESNTIFDQYMNDITHLVRSEIPQTLENLLRHSETDDDYDQFGNENVPYYYDEKDYYNPGLDIFHESGHRYQNDNEADKNDAVENGYNEKKSKEHMYFPINSEIPVIPVESKPETFFTEYPQFKEPTITSEVRRIPTTPSSYTPTEEMSTHGDSSQRVYIEEKYKTFSSPTPYNEKVLYGVPVTDSEVIVRNVYNSNEFENDHNLMTINELSITANPEVEIEPSVTSNGLEDLIINTDYGMIPETTTYKKELPYTADKMTTDKYLTVIAIPPNDDSQRSFVKENNYGDPTESEKLNVTTSRTMFSQQTESSSYKDHDAISDTANIRANTQEDFLIKTKSDFSSATGDLPLNHQAMVNPCYYSYPVAPYKSATTFDNAQVLKLVPANTPKMTQYMLNPPMYPYMQMPYMQPPQYLPNYVQPVQQQSSNSPIQVSGPGGQYYICNPIPSLTNNIASLPGIEVRRNANKLQDMLEDMPEEKGLDALIICPNGQFGCEDGSRCIPKYQVCDNEVQCDDGSDEVFCNCKDRVGKLRVCDGYFDCPNGEDEQGCFGCSADEFSCDDWSRFRKSSCIPIEQRCDNIRQCEITGKDEEDCSALTDRVGTQPQYKISNAVGFLHRNFKGVWYPSCFGTEIWATDICKTESGPSTTNPRSHMMLTMDTYEGLFINILPNNEVSLVNTCVKDRAAFVECPPLFCGLRMTLKNPYRPQEVDTAAEEIINELERVGNKPNLTNFNSSTDDTLLSISRVVGGKPSQPAAWPWLVSIYKNGIFHCGGVLVNELWVVTAAHCVDKYWQYYYEIQAGMLRRFSYSPMEQRRWVATIASHENYDKGTLKHDIGLMKLSAPVRFNRYVRPICLPSEATAGRGFIEGPSAGTICTTVGWGATVEHGSDLVVLGFSADHMREVEVPVLNHCKHPDDQEADEICAGLSEGGKDACQGDSGGPFMCRNPNNPSQWYLAGIVSHGEGCARPDEPGVYTRVSKYVGWIAENMKEFKFVPRVPLQKCPGFVCKGTGKCLPKKHHCDKIVDCLFGDDEMDCKYGFHDIFKHARDNVYFDKSKGEDDEEDYENTLGEIDPNIKIIQSNSSSNLSQSVYTVVNTEETNEEIGPQIKPLSTISNETDTTTSTYYDNSTNITYTYFKCQTMLQLIPIYQKCNKMIDCEDGTDEMNCLCVDYIKNNNPSAICDGVTDCFDLSDENMCAECNKTFEYHCRQSQTCIDLTKRCDRVADCSKGEDEWDCAALTDGATLTLDSDLRPQLAMSGIITINRFGAWRPFCANMSDDEPSIATNVCNLLGFEEYVGYQKYQVEDKPLNVTMVGFQGADYEPSAPSNMCDGLYVKCSNVSLDSSVHNVYRDNVTRDIELYTSPWNAVIYSDGIYRCMGTILNPNWIVTSVNCFEGIAILKSNYVTVLLGKGKSHLGIKGPHELILRIVETVRILDSDIMLLRVEKDIIFSRYIKHASLNNRRDGHRKERCFAVGLDDNKTRFIYMSPIENCYVGYRCFESKIAENCQDMVPWIGAIVCDSGSGWYPAAVYAERNGYCGLSSVNKYTNLKYFKNAIFKAMKQAPFKVDAPLCDGFRCALGECISKHKTCDGIPDCRNGEDEDPLLCYGKEMLCHLTDNCVCSSSEIKCNKHKCIPKSSFCDRKNDCGEYEDEPDMCTCKNYLQLTNASKICDGVIHCRDRSDEDPKFCPCKQGSFRCGDGSLCVANEMVCDGNDDCPNGEDEETCISFSSPNDQKSNAGEVLTCTGGIWHTGCFNRNYTISELEEICGRLGFPDRSANQLSPPRSIDNPTAQRPVIDSFSIVWIHRQPGNKLKLGIRTGNVPYITFEPDEECFRLFLACM